MSDLCFAARVGGVAKAQAVSMPARFARTICAMGVGVVLLAGSLPHATAQATVKLLTNINGFAGTGVQGETTPIPANTQALAVKLTVPSGLGFDAQGNVYVADFTGYVIHKIDNLGVITVVAGTPAVNCTTNTAATNPCGDNGPATAATFTNPYVIAVDRAGNIFVADTGDNRIREISATTGIITTIVGTGANTNVFNSTTPTAATTVNINAPDGIAVDSQDNVYFSDSNYSVIYKYFGSGANAGKVERYVGTAGASGFTGDNGISTSAEVNNPIGLAVDAAGDLYIADQYNNRVRVVNAATQIITTIAGTGAAGYTGDNGTAINATFNNPRSVAIDYAGNLLISDSQNLVIRIVYATNGVVGTNSYIQTVAGTGAACAAGTNPCGDGGLAINATFAANAGGSGGSTQFAFDLAKGTYYIADLNDNRVRSLTPSNIFPATPVAMSKSQPVGLQVVAGGLAISSITTPGSGEFVVGAITGCTVNGTTVNAAGTICTVPVTFTPKYPGNRSSQLVIATPGGNFYYGVSGVGTSPEVALNSAKVLDYAGTGTAGNTTGATAITSQISAPRYSVVDGAGNLWFADTANNLVRKVTAAGVMSTFAGGGANPTTCAGSTDAVGDGCTPTNAILNGPWGVAVDAAGDVYISDTQNNRIREVNAQTGVITTIAGTGTAGYTGDTGLATAATFKTPTGLVFDSVGNLYIADTGNNAVRTISSGSLYIFTYAGTGTACAAPTSTPACGDGAAATSATLNFPTGLGVDPNDNLLIADTTDARIRLVTKATGFISTAAGNGTAVFSGDGGAATSAGLNAPLGVASDAAGDYYIADNGDNRIRQVEAATGTIGTLAGGATAVCATAIGATDALGNGCMANAVTLNNPVGVTLDGPGNVYISDTGNHEVRQIDVDPASLFFTPVTGTVVGTTSTDSPQLAYYQNIGNTALTLYPPTAGNNASISTGFTIGTGGTCPTLSNGSASSTVAVGGQCSYSVSFKPTVAGTITGQLVETDNSLNATSAAPATQTFSLNGLAIPGGGTGADTLTASPNPTTLNTPVTLTDTIPVVNGVCPTGAVTFYNNGTSIGAGSAPVLANPATTPATCVSTLTTNNLPAGTNPITTVLAADANYAQSTSTPTPLNVYVTGAMLSANPATGDTYGTPVTLTDTIAPVGGACPTILATFSNGATTLGTAGFTLTGGSCVAVYPTSPATLTSLPVGMDNLTATTPASGEFPVTNAPLSYTVAKGGGPNTYTLTISPNPSIAGASVTLTDTIPALNGVCPTGAVTFVNGGGTTIATGSTPALANPATNPATCVSTATTTALPAGATNITADLATDANYAASTSNTVAANVTSAALTANPATGDTYGTPVTLKDTIAPIGGACPTVPATFSNGATTLGTAAFTLTGGSCVATYPTSPATLTSLPVGPDNLTATTTAAGSFPATSAPLTYTVAKGGGPNTDTLTISPNPSTSGSTVTLTDTIPALNGVCPTGAVTFVNGGGTTLATGSTPALANPATNPATCVSTATTTALPSGATNITADLATDANYAASTSNTVAANVTNAALTAGPATGDTYGTPVTLTDTLAPIGGACPTVPATFLNGATTLGTAAFTLTGGSCVATYPTSPATLTSLPVGPDNLTATTPAAGSFPATSAPLTYTVAKGGGPNTDTLTVSPNPSTSGATVTLTDTIPALNGVCPTGAVTFVNGGGTTIAMGSTPALANPATNPATCVSTATTTALPSGATNITADLATDANYAASTSNTVAANVTNAALSASPATGDQYGSPVTLTDTVAPIGGACPTVPATFSNGATTLGTANFTLIGGSCVATYPTSPATLTTLPVGMDNLTATTPTSGAFSATNAPLTYTVSKGGGPNTDTLTISPNPSTSGSTVTLTDTIPALNGACPTGAVTFVNGGGTTIATGSVPALANPATNPATCVSTATTTALPTGATNITADLATDTNYAASTSNTVAANVTNAALTSNAPPTGDTYGTPITLTDTIAPIGGACPTVPATFSNGATTLGTAGFTLTGGNCVATFPTAPATLTNLPVGMDNLTATTPASGSFPATSAPLSLMVGKAPVTNTVTPTLSDSIGASPNPQTFGSMVTLTFSIPVPTGDTAPMGSVTFTFGATTLNTTPATFTAGATANGITTYTATATTTVLPQGADTVIGTYTGDGNYAGGPLSTNEQINAATGTSSLTANPSPTTFGTPVTITEMITPINGMCPAGPATFLNNGAPIGTGIIMLSGGQCVATLVTNLLPVGMDSLTATAPASNGFAATSTGPTNLTVGKATGVGDMLTTGPNPSIFGQQVTLTEILPTVGGVAPSGSVNFYNNGVLIGTGVVNSGVATLLTTTLPGGTDPITATYTGDSNYAQVTSGPVPQVVNMSNGTATLAVGPNPATFGTPVTITETVTPVNGMCPVGPTTFLNNGAPIGTAPVNLMNGQCIATITLSNLPVGTDSITATIPGDSNFSPITSGPVALVVNKANGADTLGSSPNPSTFGQSVTITDTIPTVAGVAPTGTVNFYSYGVLIGTGPVSNGVATLMTSNLAAGTDSLTGVYQGDGNYAQVTAGPVNQIVNQVATVPTLSAGPNPTTFGMLVTISETIPVVNGTPATGSVNFYDNGVLIGTGTLTNGVATIMSTTLPVGTDPITATYAGNGTYAAVNSGPLNVMINKANGADMLAVNPDPAVFGTTVTIMDTVPTVGGVAPTGTVTFYNNGTAIGTAPVTNGVATLMTTTLPVGSNPITANYGGDNNYATVTTGPVNEVITVGSTTPVLGATPNPTTFGTQVTITESIPGINGVTPTGSVNFYSNGTLIGTGTVMNGVATLKTSTLPIGTDPITATYLGDNNYAAANSGPLNVVIKKAAPLDTVVATPANSTFGMPVTLVFTVPLVNGVVPTGTVTFFNGTTQIGTANVNALGIATLVTSSLPVGTDAINTQYPGDNTYAAANPNTSETVGKAVFGGTNDTLTSSNLTPLQSQPVTLTFTVATINGVAPTGTVSFYNGTTLIGTGTVTNGVATLTTSTLPPGTDTINATYSGDGTYSGGTLTVIEKVTANDFSIAATPATQTINPGDTAVYTVSLTGVNGPFTSPVTLTATGLPADATVTFGTTTYVPGAGPTPTSMTIVTSPLHALAEPVGFGPKIYYGLLLLPLLGIRRLRRKIRSLPKGIVYGIAALAMLGGLGAITGCDGGYFGPAGAHYTITVTGTSGTLVHSTTVTLTVR